MMEGDQRQWGDGGERRGWDRGGGGESCNWKIIRAFNRHICSHS